MYKANGHHKGTDKELVKVMYNGGMPQNEIAHHFGVSEPTICKMLKPVKEQEQTLQEFRNKEADIIDLARAGILNKLSDGLSKIDPTTSKDLQSLSTCYAILYDKQALMRGKATSHVGVATYEQSTEELARLQQVIEKLEEGGGEGKDATPDSIMSSTSRNFSTKRTLPVSEVIVSSPKGCVPSEEHNAPKGIEEATDVPLDNK